MKRILLFGLFFISFTVLGQTLTTRTSKILSSKYNGFYSYGKDVEKGTIGSIIINAETDSTILFYIDLNRGAPSYNMGSLYGRVIIINDSGTFFTKMDHANNGCKWVFVFTKNHLSIKTVDGQYDCGFGHAVFADGVFIRRSSKSQDYFEDMEGNRVYFKNTKPEDYNKK